MDTLQNKGRGRHPQLRALRFPPLLHLPPSGPGQGSRGKVGFDSLLFPNPHLPQMHSQVTKIPVLRESRTLTGQRTCFNGGISSAFCS